MMPRSEPDEHSDTCHGVRGSRSVRPYRRACPRSDCGSRRRASPADAQAASAKPKANTAGPPVTVRVTNSRKANLVWLAAAEPGSANWTTVLGVVKAGKKASTKLSQVSDCHVDLHGRFADGQSMDASGFNVCADKTLNLTD